MTLKKFWILVILLVLLDKKTLVALLDVLLQNKVLL